MATRRCQHIGCNRESHTGFWCQNCIEQEWPYASLGDDQHWIVWKGVYRIRANFFSGALGCPYRLGQVIVPYDVSNWLLSPLGAIKEEYGDHILAAIVLIQKCKLRGNLVLDCAASPVLPVTAFARFELPNPPKAKALLKNINANLIQIEAFERQMRARVSISQTQIQTQMVKMVKKMVADSLDLLVRTLEDPFLEAMQRHFPQRLAKAARLLPLDQVFEYLYSPSPQQRRRIIDYLEEQLLETKWCCSHEKFLPRLFKR